MATNKIIIPEKRPIIAKVRDNQRKPYNKPQIIELGDLRTLTLGGSPGFGDSSNPGTRNPFGASSPFYMPGPDEFPPY